MSDLQQAQEIAKLHGEAFITALCKFVATVRLDEAKFFYHELSSEQLPFWLVEKIAMHISALEQAAGGSAAGSLEGSER